jgi:hypothetical protein
MPIAWSNPFDWVTGCWATAAQMVRREIGIAYMKEEKVISKRLSDKYLYRIN